MTDATPVALPAQKVKPEWIDYNGHMNVAYYMMAYDQGIDRFLDAEFGLGEAGAAASGQGLYALQTHIHHLGELLEGEAFILRIRVLDSDAKRLHLFAEMEKEGSGETCATFEQMLMNVDLATRRSAPFPEAAAAGLAAMRDAQAGLERPAQAGAPLGIRRRPA